MLLKWSWCVLLIVLIVELDQTSSRSSTSGSRSSSSSSRGSSYGSSSRGSSFGSGSRGSSSSYNRPFTPRPTPRRYPVTTMPTRRTTRYHPITTMPTRRTTRYHPITTMPTRRTTKYHPMTTMPTHRTTPHRQPPFNPNFPPSNRYNYTTKHYPMTTPSTHRTTQHTRQPPFNPNFPPAGKNHSSGNYISTSTVRSVFNTPPRFGTNSSKSHFNTSTHRPFVQTTKVVTVGNWNSGRPTQPWRPNNTNHNTWTQRPIYTTAKPIYQVPSWNRSSIHHGPSIRNGSTHGGIYQPPASRRNTTLTGHGVNPLYPTQPVIHPPPSTTVINNNNHYYQPGHYAPPSTGPAHITIINNNNYHHQVIPPTVHYHSYGPPPVGITITTHNYDPLASLRYQPTYHYSSQDTGSSALGFFLGYQLGKITRPSYYYHSTSYVNNEYVPRYDHYTVHHYYHNSEAVPKEAPIQPNAVVVCAGDSSNICPPGTMPFCTNNGVVMCVVNAIDTSPCSTNKQLKCATSTISCENNSSPECKQKSSTSVSIPCVSTATIPAGLGYVNNSLIVTDTNDSSLKTFCVTVLATPTKNESKSGRKDQSVVQNNEPFHYTTNHTGVDLLGYYLGHKLQNLVQPSFSFLNYDQNYNFVEKFDHYNVFQYYHDANVLPNQVEIKPDQIMSCAGDSGTFCPQYTVSLCLNDGAVICVTDKTSTTFSNELQTNNVNSSIPCDNLKFPFCVQNPNATVPLQIPCFSTAKVYANISIMIRSYAAVNETQTYRTYELSNVTAGVAAQTIPTPRELCVAILVLPGEKTISKVPERRKVTGIPNAPNSLTLPKYSYKNLGTNTLGLFLQYRLPRTIFPTYYYINAYLYSESGIAQQFDHYSVHYHDHGNEVIPTNLEFQAFDLRACEGDTGLICPNTTSSICLNDGGVMCLTDMLLTKSCSKNNTTRTLCTKATLTCENNKPCSKISKVKKIGIPCISIVTIYGDIMTVRHNIYKRTPTLSRQYTDIQAVPGSNVNNTPVYHKAQQFCVSVVLLPEARQISEGEKVIESSDSLFGKIASKLFGSW
ncbi:uncharacterized protein [Diabrotica undecimpunctata]|uniref:uncharacterized protein isoform X2 n=1 Tax=Diabrotica undecimpunctata TaxID=50387 RepID=UPI003B63C68E